MKLFNSKWFIVLVHIAIWVVYLYSPYFFRPSNTEFIHGDAMRNHFMKEPLPPPLPHNYIHSIFTHFNMTLDVILVSFFYLNAYVLLPKLAYRKKYFSYAVSITAFICFIIVAHIIIFNPALHPPQFRPGPPLGAGFFRFLTILACSIAYKTIIDKIAQDKLAKEKENENLKTELSLLRSQVSPHFMFNVLNSMVYMARMKSDNLEPSLIKLSSLMRYMLYDADEDKVPLQSEIEYLESYIDLQKQRFEDTVKVNVTIDVDSMNHYIEPMLLIPFVENAFKHGTGMIDDATINIVLHVREHELKFVVTNNYNELLKETKDKISGIGLANVIRRLNLLYRNDYKLDIKDENGLFEIHLTLKLT